MRFSMLRLTEGRKFLLFIKPTLCRKLMAFSFRSALLLFKTLFCNKLIICFLFFFQCCDEVAEKYPEIEYEKVVIDNCCMMVSYIQHVLSSYHFFLNLCKGQTHIESDFPLILEYVIDIA